MAQESFERKLTTIFSADAVGYSRLMGKDETATVRTLTAYQKVMTDLILQHRGRVIDSPGDNLLAEFSSVVDAVQCAVAVQKELQSRNDALPEDRKMAFRIGINLGDVIQEGERIYGDGVNIAARLEGLADPGGICISKTAFDQIATKLPYGYDFIGNQAVKNINHPVGVYKVSMEPRVTAAGQSAYVKDTLSKRMLICFGVIAALFTGIALVIWTSFDKHRFNEVASEESMVYSLPDMPSIAVLPFENLSGNSDDNTITDGISISIITALSKIPKLFVIDQDSTFSYKEKEVGLKTVAEELGIRYVLKGSLQKKDDQLRINVQLIDALTGAHLWGEKYDRSINDIFAMQDNITMKITKALQVELSEGPYGNILVRGTNNLEAYLKIIRGYQEWKRHNRDGDTLAQRLAKEAIALDPNYAAAYSLLSRTQWRSVAFRTAENPKEMMQNSLNSALKAVELDKSADTLSNLGWVYTRMGQHDKGVAIAENALNFNPNSSRTYSNLGLTFLMGGRCEDAVPMFENAMRLSPIPSANILFHACTAYQDCGRYSKCITAGKRAVELAPDSLFAHLYLASCYARAGYDNEARESAGEVLRINPNYRVSIRTGKSYKYKEDSDSFRMALISAGIPQETSLDIKP